MTEVGLLVVMDLTRSPPADQDAINYMFRFIQAHR